MKKLLIISGIIAAVLALTATITKFYNVSIILVLVAFFSGLILLFGSNTKGDQPKSVKYIFLTLIIALSLTIYKNIFTIKDTTDAEQVDSTSMETINDVKSLKNQSNIK